MRKLVIVFGLLILLVVVSLSAFGWGRDGHRFINAKAVYHLPGQMTLFIQDSSFFASHASDADTRKSSDTSEGVKHYIDIDNYPSFRTMPRRLDSVIAMYGRNFVWQQGILPWATLWAYDSLVAQLRRGDWNRAKLTASDIGHYVGDAHQPLHATKWYDGRPSNNGIHSRYESSMITTYFNSLFIVADTAGYPTSRLDFVFDNILHSNDVVDAVLHADTVARVVSGWTPGNGNPPASYYAELWNQTRTLTLDQMQRGTRALASLWFSAWVDAGLILPTGAGLPSSSRPAEFALAQNYPNPFNPATTIAYSLPVGGTVSLRVFSVDGREIAALVEGNQSAGEHVVRFDARNLASGVYFYKLQMGGFAQMKKLLILR